MSNDLLWLALTALMTGLFWLPYVLERILRIGIPQALGYATASGTASFSQPHEKPAKWAIAAHAAHLNAVENLPVFATLVLTAHLAGANEPTVAVAAQIYFLARLAHFMFYVWRVPVVRTLTFIAGCVAEFVIAAAIFQVV